MLHPGFDWSSTDRGVFLVNALGIVHNPETKHILIGRRQSDPHIPALSWCFPGGRPDYEQDIEVSLQNKIQKKTGLSVSIEELIFAKTYPEKREFLSLYYLCHVTGGLEHAGEAFVETKWIHPNEVTSYFTTSIHPTILAYLNRL